MAAEPDANHETNPYVWLLHRASRCDAEKLDRTTRNSVNGDHFVTGMEYMSIVPKQPHQAMRELKRD